ncbi:hypothetical protein ACLKA6_001216 [Drosophila palustris]
MQTTKDTAQLIDFDDVAANIRATVQQSGAVCGFVPVDHPIQSSSRAVELNFDSSTEATEIESREREAGGMFILKPIRQT